jgi:peptide-methionine (R)-S-oxide reductase
MTEQKGLDMSEQEIKKSDDEWREELTPEQYDILRRAGTEPPFSGAYNFNKATGMYRCAGCGAELFSSDAKFDSGSGWPSFTEPAIAEVVELRPDNSMFMKRTEVVCRRCGGHLGHVFDDGPGPTGQRYCINSLALDFDEQAPAEGQDAATAAPAQPTGERS